MADPFEFDPDFRWFEPIYDADLADMKPKKRANYGWFATYDRLNLYGTRPELENNQQGLESGMDSGWGHRYEIGYMLPDADSGWMFSWVNNGVGEFFTVRQERGNRINEDALDEDGATNPAPPFGFEAIPGISNNLGFNYRFVDVQDTLNVFDFNSYELSKTWRLEPYHYGGILEPLVGVRWFRIDDTNADSNFISSNDPAQIAFPTLVTQFGNSAEQLTIDTALTENEAVTAQLGFRYFKFIDRFTVSSDFRVFSGVNFQSTSATRYVETTVYDTDEPILQGDEVERILYSQTAPVHSRNDEFFLGFDVRGEVAYQLTRMISVRGGFQLIDVARGLWRGGDADNGILRGGDNDQDLQMVGATFGITLNR